MSEISTVPLDRLPTERRRPCSRCGQALFIHVGFEGELACPRCGEVLACGSGGGRGPRRKGAGPGAANSASLTLTTRTGSRRPLLAGRPRGGFLERRRVALLVVAVSLWFLGVNRLSMVGAVLHARWKDSVPLGIAPAGAPVVPAASPRIEPAVAPMVPVAAALAVAPVSSSVTPGASPRIESRPTAVVVRSGGPDDCEMVVIPAGSFLMGSADGRPDEKPVHRVALDSFLIDRMEVTNRRYRAFVEATGHRTPWEAIGFLADDQAVTGVSWDDATAYCQWARKRLPTEAEWERAARGGLEGQTYPWGSAEPTGRACFNGTKLGSVRQFQANRFGLYGMAGNVFEWCADRYDEKYYQASPERNPAGPGSGGARVVRGGSWGYSAALLRCSNRSRIAATLRFYNVGFRCARSLR